MEILIIINITGVAWLSSVRIVKSEVSSANGRNPYC
jgi:hypothetical protein